MEIDIDSYAALAQGDEDIEVELDERDFQDPHLLVNLLTLLHSMILMFVWCRTNCRRSQILCLKSKLYHLDQKQGS